MMRLLRDGTDLSKLLMVCLLILRGTCTESPDGAVLANLTLVTTDEPSNIQTKETTSEGTTSGAIIISSKSTSHPTSTASATENPGVDITSESTPATLHKDSETTTGQPSMPNYDTGSTENLNIPSPNGSPANAVSHDLTPNVSLSEIQASTKNLSFNTSDSDTTSTISIPARLVTDSVEITTGQDSKQTTIELTEATTYLSTKVPESKSIPKSTAGTLDIITNLAEITTDSEVTTNIAKDLTSIAEATTNIAEAITNISEATTNIAEATTNIAEATTNIADATTNIADATTNIAEATTNIAEAMSNLAEATTDLKDAKNIAEISTNNADVTTNPAEVTTNLAVTVRNIAESTENLAETATNLAPEEVTTDLAAVAADSTEGTTSRVVTHRPDASSTRTSTLKNHLETNEIPSVVWFILILDGNCTHLARGRQGQRESGLKRQIIENLTSWLDIAKEDVTIPAGVVCTPEGRVHANLSLFQSGGAANISGKLKSLEDMKGPLFRFHGQEFYVYQILTADGFLNKEPDIPVDLRHTDVELLIYITVGSTCSFLFLLAMALLVCKYCPCREQKPFEFGEPPNANMRLEDYTLTRIPRPKLGYVEYCRGLGKRYCPLDDRLSGSTSGMVQPFDTSVVPLEDARVQDFRDGVIVRPSDIRRLGGSLSRAYHAGCCGGYVNDADGYCIHSTENLHRAHKVDRYVDKGVDNPNFY